MKAQCCFLDSCVAFTSCKDSIANYSCVTIFSRVQGRWLETGRSSLLVGIGSFDVADSRFWFELVSSILDASMMACIFRCSLFSCLFDFGGSESLTRACSVDSVEWNLWILFSETGERSDGRTCGDRRTCWLAGTRTRLRHTSKRPSGWTGARPKKRQSWDQNWA